MYVTLALVLTVLPSILIVVAFMVGFRSVQGSDPGQGFVPDFGFPEGDIDDFEYNLECSRRLGQPTNIRVYPHGRILGEQRVIMNLTDSPYLYWGAGRHWTSSHPRQSTVDNPVLIDKLERARVHFMNREARLARDLRRQEQEAYRRLMD